MSSAPQRNWRRNRPRGQLRRGGLVAVSLLILALGCDGSPSSPSTVPDASSSVRETRTFSGTVSLPTPTEMNVTLVVDAARTARSSGWPTLVATLIAQETRRVTGTYTIDSNPGRRGRVEGTFEGASFLTAGMFRGMLVEEGPGCNPRQSYEGPVTAAGVSWTPTSSSQRCAGRLLEFTPLELNAGDGPETDGDGGDGGGDGAPLVTISLAGSGGGTVTSNPPGLDCSASGQDGCTSQFAAGVEVALTAVPAEGSVFAGWSGDADCDDGRLTMDGPRRCTATFNTSGTGAGNRRLTVQVTGQGSGTVTSSPAGIDCPEACAASFGVGTVVTLTPTAAPGSVFAGWTGAADCADGSVTMSAARTCTATFRVQGTPPPSGQTVTIEVVRGGSGSGTVTSTPAGIDCGVQCVAEFRESVVVTLTAVAAAGSTFAGWSGDADCADGVVTAVDGLRCTATFDTVVVANNTLTVTLAGDGSGTITSSPEGIVCGGDCSEGYAPGSIVILSPVPDAGSTFGGWSGHPDCADGTLTMSASRSCTATFDLIPPNTLAVTLSGTGSGSVTSAPAGIDCGSDCSESYAPGTPVTLTATPDVGSTFVDWSGDCTGTNLSTNVTMDASRGCIATFDIMIHTLTVNRIGGGSGSVTSSPVGIGCPTDCSEDYFFATAVTLMAFPDAGSVFAGWGDACDAGGNVTMDADKTCTAAFDPIPQFTLTVDFQGTGSGTVTSAPPGINCIADCNALFDDGTGVTLSAFPDGGSVFSGWGDACDAGGNVTVDDDKMCTATFDPIPQFTLTVDFQGTGSGTVTSAPPGINCTADCSALFDDGTGVTLSAFPDAGSVFSGWGDACDAGGTVTVDADKTCTATFDPVPQFTLTVIVDGGGSGTVTSSPPGISCPSDCDESYDDGTMVTLTATPGGMSTFATWSGPDCSGTNPVVNVTVDAARSCTATFDPNP